LLVSSNLVNGRDFYANDLTINDGVTFNTNGYRIFVSGTLTLGSGAGGAKIGRDNPGQTALSGGDIGTSFAGGTNANGNSATTSIGGAGGNAGARTGGTVTNPPATDGGPNPFHSVIGAVSGRTFATNTLVNGGAGGAGSGAGNTGGGGGGVVLIFAHHVACVGTGNVISANGGPGTGATAAGGGGGGVVWVVSSDAQPSPCLTVQALGGPASGTGVAGSPGTATWVQLP
jgi:hypothetical protein